VAVILWLNAPVNQWLAAGGFQRSQDMAILVIAGALAYFGTLALAGVRIRHFRHR